MYTLPSSTPTPGSQFETSDAWNGTHENGCAVPWNANGASPWTTTATPRMAAATRALSGSNKTVANAAAVPATSTIVSLRGNRTTPTGPSNTSATTVTRPRRIEP